MVKKRKLPNRAKKKAKNIPLRHFKLKKVQELIGFSMNSAKQGEQCQVCFMDTLTSDESRFYSYIDGITKEYLSPKGISPTFVSQFVAIIHPDLSADVYINEFPIIMEILRKVPRSINAGDPIFESDIADINSVKFPSIRFKSEDRIAICVKVGWKFGLHFNFNRNGLGDVEAIPKIMADIYRYLTFQYVYHTFKPEPGFIAMLKDGWFPFSAIIGNPFRQLAEAYKSNSLIDDRKDVIVAHFDKKKFDELMQRWNSKALFKEKEAILLAGIESYLQNNYIACIKTLSSEIDGLLRLIYFHDSNRGKVKTNEMIENIIKRKDSEIGSANSLLLPNQFLAYLKDYMFAGFSLKDGELPLSRHSVGHGVAKAEDYTQEKALQFILTIDQISYFL